MDAFFKEMDMLKNHQVLKKKEVDNFIKVWEKRLRLKDMKEVFKKKWGLQRNYRSKKETLQRMVYLWLRNSNTHSILETVRQDLFYENEEHQLRDFYMHFNEKSVSEKRRGMKLFQDIVKDSKRDELYRLFKICGLPFTFRSKAELLDYLLLAIFEKTSVQVVEVADCKDMDCLICTENVEKGIRLEKCTCKMIYHEDCLQKWLTINHSCPTCRVKV